MSQLAPDNKNVPATRAQRFSFLIPPQEEKISMDTGTKKPLFQQGVEFIRQKVSRLPLDLSSDADADRDKALGDSVRAGVVDDVGVEENRRIFKTRMD